jgi:hypothetical protein
MSGPVSVEVAACMGRFFTGGADPRHSDLSAVFMRTGYDPDDPYVESAVRQAKRYGSALFLRPPSVTPPERES